MSSPLEVLEFPAGRGPGRTIFVVKAFLYLELLAVRCDNLFVMVKTVFREIF